MKVLQTELNDRVLRFDGVSEVSPDQVAHLLLLGVPTKKLRVTETTPDIEAFNRQVPVEDEIRLAAPEPVTVNLDWAVPEPYISLDLTSYMLSKFEERCMDKYDEDEKERAFKRIEVELAEVESRGMTEFMRTVIYVLETLRARNVVWGVGRGSSCASYLLFIVGLHAVDCVRFDVPLEEFYHE